MFAELNMAYPIALMFFLTSAGYVYKAVATIVSDPNSKHRQEYLLSIACVALSSLFYGLMTIAENETLQRVFWTGGFVSFFFFLPVWIRFSSSMITVKHEGVRKLFRHGIPAIAAVICLLCIMSDWVRFVSTPYGTQFSYTYDIIFDILGIFTLFLCLVVFFIHFKWWRESKLKRNKQQQFWFVLLTFIVAPIGFTTDFLLPIYTDYTFTPLVPILLFPASLQLFLSMRANKTLSITVPNITEFIFKTGKVPRIVLDYYDKITLANDAALNYLGKDVIGKNFSDIIFDSYDAENFQKKHLFNENFGNRKVKIFSKSGIKICEISLTIEYDKYGDALCKVAILRDITDREHKSDMQKLVNQIATLLLDSEKTVFENKLTQCMEIIEASVDLDGISIWRNFVSENGLHTGQIYHWDKVMGGCSIPEEGLDDIYLPDTLPTIGNILSNGKTFNGAVSALPESALFSSFGVVSMFAVPIFIGNEFWGAVLYEDKQKARNFDEITSEMMFSAALLFVNSIIRNETVESLRKTSFQRDEAYSATQAKTTFLAQMSHEIRTPMNTILGTVEILMQNKKLSDGITEGLDKIYTACNMLLGIINDILDFSKIESGKLEILSLKYEIASLIIDSIHLNMMKIESKPIEFELNIDENIPRNLIGDELRIKQILNNLLSNAFKYTDAGKVILKVSCEPAEKGIVLVIKVEDTGHGMTQKQAAGLFVEYSRFNKDESTEGSGLGLSIVHRLLGLMNGEISVESELDKGTEFTVRIPQGVMDPNNTLGKDMVDNLQFFRISQKGRDRRQVVRNPMPYGRILIVDDVATNIYVAVGLMRLYNLQIETAESGFEAIKKIQNGKVYDIIFMDHMMPKMDGMETVKILRMEFGYKNPIVALTANAVVGQSERFLQNGFDAFISKPIDVRQLDHILNKYVRDKQSAEVIESARLQIGGQVEQKEEVMENSDNKIITRILSTKINGLNMLSGLERYEGDNELYLKVLHSYASNVSSMLDTIETADENTLADYKIIVHGIKGASFDIFAEEIGVLAKELEHASDTGDLDFVLKNNAEFHEKTRKLIAELEDMLAIIAAENPKPQKDKPDTRVLQKLVKACRDFSMDGADEAMAEIEKYQYTADDGLASFLREKIDVMDFDAIIEKLEAVL